MADAAVRDELVRFLESVVRPGQDIGQWSDQTNLVDAGVMDSLALIQIIYYLESEHALELHTLGIDPSQLTSIDGILQAISKGSG